MFIGTFCFSLSDLTLSPILSHSNTDITRHCEVGNLGELSFQLLLQSILTYTSATKLLWGGKPLSEKHQIPSQYGSFEPTAIAVDLDALLTENDLFTLATTELFAPFQVCPRKHR